MANGNKENKEISESAKIQENERSLHELTDVRMRYDGRVCSVRRNYKGI